MTSCEGMGGVVYTATLVVYDNYMTCLFVLCLVGLVNVTSLVMTELLGLHIDS